MNIKKSYFMVASDYDKTIYSHQLVMEYRQSNAHKSQIQSHQNWAIRLIKKHDLLSQNITPSHSPYVCCAVLASYRVSHEKISIFNQWINDFVDFFK